MTEEVQELSKGEEAIAEAILKFKDQIKGADQESFLKILDQVRFITAFAMMEGNPKVDIQGTIEDTSEENMGEIMDRLGMVPHYHEETQKWHVYVKEYGGVCIIVDRNKVVAQMRGFLTIYEGRFCGLSHVDMALFQIWQKVNNTNENPFREGDDMVVKAAESVGIDLDKLEKDIKDEYEQAIANQ